MINNIIRRNKMENNYELLGIYPMEYLKFKFKQKFLSEKKFFLINEYPIHENDNINDLEGEYFKKHPYLPIYASNFGRIKDKNKIIKQYILKEGYLYVFIKCNTEKLKYETWEENLRMENGLQTPIIQDIAEYEEVERTKFEKEKFEWHPNIQIGVSNYGNIKNNYNGKYYGRYFKIFENKYVNIPVYVYRIVAETFIENPNYECYNIAHHISNNGYDNSIYNLMWVNNDQHIMIEK
jgi:hypothetical protein